MDVLHQLALPLRQGGFVMPPLVLAAALLWYALAWRAMALRRGGPRSIPATAVARGLELARSRPGAGDRRDAGGAELRSRLDEAFFDLDVQAGRYAGLVRALVRAAPLAGLLGTVSGLIGTFEALAAPASPWRAGGVADGIAQALLSTQMGLAVAIPGLLLGRALDRRQARLEAELDGLKDRLCRAPGAPA